MANSKTQETAPQTEEQQLPETAQETTVAATVDATADAVRNDLDNEATINAKLGEVEDTATNDALSWEQCEREDLKNINAMLAHGWTVEFTAADIRGERTTPENPPADTVSFTKGSNLARTHIDFSTHKSLWNVIDHRGINEARRYDTLLEVLENED